MRNCKNIPSPVLECLRFLTEDVDVDDTAPRESYLAIKGSVGKL